MKKKIIIIPAVAMIAVLGFLFFKPHGYSWNHPWVIHDCRMLANLCPSHDAVWAPPGGEAYSVYGACACAATVHAVVGG